MLSSGGGDGDVGKWKGGGGGRKSDARFSGLKCFLGGFELGWIQSKFLLNEGAA